MQATQTRPTRTPPPPPKSTVVKRYRLLAGMHAEYTDSGRKDAQGVPIMHEEVYFPGDPIETATNLMERNAPGKPPKFAMYDSEDSIVLNADSRVWDSSREPIEEFVKRMKAEGIGQPASKPKPELTALNEKELRALAADNEIDLSKCKTHADVMKTMQAAFA